MSATTRRGDIRTAARERRRKPRMAARIGLATGFTAVSVVLFAIGIAVPVPSGAAGNPGYTLTTLPRQAPPSAVRDLTATPGPGRVLLRWRPPASRSGVPVAYIVRRAGSSRSWRTVASSIIIADASEAVSTYEVTPRNVLGTGPATTVTAAPLRG